VQLSAELLVDLYKLLVRAGVDKVGSMSLPVLFEHLAHRIDDFGAIVLRRVVASCNHDANDLAIELATPQAGEEAQAEDGSAEQRRCGTEASSAVFVIHTRAEIDHGMTARGLENVGENLVMAHCACSDG